MFGLDSTKVLASNRRARFVNWTNPWWLSLMNDMFSRWRMKSHAAWCWKRLSVFDHKKPYAQLLKVEMGGFWQFYYAVGWSGKENDDLKVRPIHSVFQTQKQHASGLHKSAVSRSLSAVSLARSLARSLAWTPLSSLVFSPSTEWW